MPCTVHNRSKLTPGWGTGKAPAEDAVGLSPDSGPATHCDAAVDPSSGAAGADVAADTDGPGMGVTPERPSGTFTFWFT